ncbi:MAG: hypothetical protein QGH25_14600, partial [Candidatus Latescibacteria bacterium]|nr:hypothetical protein [Candidatus Latescibacterota bacterium]
MRIIDPHVHVWINDPAFPWPAETTDPPADRTAEQLLELMEIVHFELDEVGRGIERGRLVQDVECGRGQPLGG